MTTMNNRLIRKLLIANRGEIACRIIRTCHDMGIATVAVFADGDVRSKHVSEADEAIQIDSDAASNPYLGIRALIAAAQRTQADAIHPGYGFLSENPEFAAACRDANLIFVGPRPEVVALMGSKREARRLVAAAGVPVVPGYDGDDQSDEAFTEHAHTLGFPIMVKASAGGGGRGMRMVASVAELPAALKAARREALYSFGDGTLLIERAIQDPRHIEFQIFGDEYGAVVHLGERECSIQRRHQKVIEEAPSPALNPELRERMGAAAIKVGRQLGYTNAGTVEFILSPEGEYYFLEVNTRLQVEHPVTEAITGLDLVRWQIDVAEGRPLPLKQEEIAFHGHAIEARVYAEDPLHDFSPSMGHVQMWVEPEGVRVDSGVRDGDEIGPRYDPMLAKIIAYEATREMTARKLGRALRNTVLLGVRTNIPFLEKVTHHSAFLAGDLSTGFIERFSDALLHDDKPPPNEPGSVELAALAVTIVRLAHASVIATTTNWRNNRVRPIIERFRACDAGSSIHDNANLPGDLEVRLQMISQAHLDADIAHGDQTYHSQARLLEKAGQRLTLEVNGRVMRAVVVEGNAHEWWVACHGQVHQLIWKSPLPEPQHSGSAASTLTAPMPGMVMAQLVQVGDFVHAGAPVLILEAMKMEHTIRAPHDGIIRAAHYEAGEQVPSNAVLFDIEPVHEQTEYRTDSGENQ